MHQNVISSGCTADDFYARQKKFAIQTSQTKINATENLQIRHKIRLLYSGMFAYFASIRFIQRFAQN